MTGLEIQSRDIEVLIGLFESRVMTLAQAAKLFFPSAESAKKRIQRLKAAGLIRERPRALYDPSVLTLTRKAFNYLKNAGHLEQYPRLGGDAFEKRAVVSDLTLRHELAVMDIKVSFTQAILRATSLAIKEFTTWPRLHEFSAPAHYSTAIVRPDSYIRLHQRQDGQLFEHSFFVEVDRSSESQRILVERGVCYGEFYRLGGFAERCGGKREEYREYPFRVLVICRTAERRNNLAEKLWSNIPSIRSLIWLTTFAEATITPLGRIWITPGDYGRSVEGTAFKSKIMPPLIYRRQKERDEHVELMVLKRTLMRDFAF